MDLPVTFTALYDFQFKVHRNCEPLNVTSATKTNFVQDVPTFKYDSLLKVAADTGTHTEINLDQLFKQKLFRQKNEHRELAYTTLAAFCHHFKFYRTIDIPKDAQKFLKIVINPSEFSAGFRAQMVLGSASKADVYELMTCEIPTFWKEIMQLEYLTQAKIDSMKEIRWFMRRSRFKLWICQQSLTHKQMLYGFKQELNHTIWALKARLNMIKQARSTIKSHKHTLRTFASALKPVVKKTWIYKVLNPIRIFFKSFLNHTP